MSLRGKRVRLITIEKRTTTTNSFNEEVETWSAATGLSETNSSGEIYAEEHHKGGDEGLQEGQVLAWQKVIWKIPMIDTLNERDYRFKYDGTIYDIESIWPIRRSNLMVKTQSQDNQ